MSRARIPRECNVNFSWLTAQTLYEWMDLLWIPIALLLMEKGKKIFTCLFILGCVLLLRLQLDLLGQIGRPNGLLGWIETDAYLRGVACYGVFIALFLLLARLSPGSDKNVHIAASITLMILAFCLSSLIMLL